MKTFVLLPFMLFAFCNSIIAGPVLSAGDVLAFNCGIPNHLTATNLSGTSALLQWNGVDQAIQYRVEVENFQTGPGFFHLDTVVNGPSLQVDDLQLGTLYKFSVSAYCDAFGLSSEWVLFSTPADNDLACTPPFLISIAVEGSSAMLFWSKTGEALPYFLEVQMEPAAPEVFLLATQTIDTFYQVTGLQAGALYKFRVSKTCGNGHGSWSDWQFFNGSTENIGAGGGEGPECMHVFGLQATGIQAGSADLSWYPVPNVKSYNLEIDYYDPGGMPWQITKVVTGNTFHLTGLSPVTRYKFKVRTNCIGGGHSTWSNWRKFQTADLVVTTEGNPDTVPGTEPRAGASFYAISDMEVAVWPNPVTNAATISLRGLQPGNCTLRVMDVAGRPVMERHFDQEKETWEGLLSFENIPVGCYLLQIRNGTTIKTVRITVVH